MRTEGYRGNMPSTILPYEVPCSSETSRSRHSFTRGNCSFLFRSAAKMPHLMMKFMIRLWLNYCGLSRTLVRSERKPHGWEKALSVWCARRKTKENRCFHFNGFLGFPSNAGPWKSLKFYTTIATKFYFFLENQETKSSENLFLFV